MNPQNLRGVQERNEIKMKIIKENAFKWEIWQLNLTKKT